MGSRRGRETRRRGAGGDHQCRTPSAQSRGGSGSPRADGSLPGVGGFLPEVVSLEDERTALRNRRERTAKSVGSFMVGSSSWALFTSKKIYKIEIVALSFVFDKYCSIMN